MDPMTTTSLETVRTLFARLGVNTDAIELAPFRGADPRELSDALKHELTFARVVHALASARQEMAGWFEEEDIVQLLQPELFPSPRTSVVHLLCAVDPFIPPALLGGELTKRLLTLSNLRRVALADALESIYYHELPAGLSLAKALARYGMPART